jgi:hypothetical protein
MSSKDKRNLIKMSSVIANTIWNKKFSRHKVNNIGNNNCPVFDLCKKRILIVGGIRRMETLYRELIESHGGVFEYHDGYVRNGSKKLESRLKRADIVVCPVNCNSHAACIIVKNLGKKYKKTVHMLASFSLSSVTRIIKDADTTKCLINEI